MKSPRNETRGNSSRRPPTKLVIASQRRSARWDISSSMGREDANLFRSVNRLRNSSWWKMIAGRRSAGLSSRGVGTAVPWVRGANRSRPVGSAATHPAPGIFASLATLLRLYCTRYSTMLHNAATTGTLNSLLAQMPPLIVHAPFSTARLAKCCACFRVSWQQCGCRITAWN